MRSKLPYPWIGFFSAICFSATFAHAQDAIIDTFDSADEVAAWSRWWGAASQTYEFDPSVDANNNVASGSLKATIGFDLAANAGDNQFALIGGFPGSATLDGTKFTNLVFDLKWDPSSPPRSTGDFGVLEFGFRKADFSQLWLIPTSPITLTTNMVNGGWLHVVAPIDPTAAGLDQITGVVLKMWSGDPVSGQTGTATFWLDNVKLIANTNQSVVSPSLSIEPAEPGLRLFASAAGSQYQRQNIRTVSPEYSWVSASQPVTYSFTIGDYPNTNHTGFQTQIFLVPGDAVPNFESSPDYNEPNVVFLDLQNNDSGGAFATFRFKTNSPSGNSMLYNSNPTNGAVGSLAGIGSAQVKGTWKLTFQNDTNVTLTTPGGSSTNFALPAAAAALFSGPLYAYFGVQPNQSANINQSAVLTRIQISGVATPIDESFAGVQSDPSKPLDLDPLVWERVAENAPGIILVPPGSPYWINWSVPATGYQLQVSPTLTSGSWSDAGVTPTQIGNQIRSLVTSTNLPTGRSAFFRLVKAP